MAYTQSVLLPQLRIAYTRIDLMPSAASQPIKERRRKGGRPKSGIPPMATTIKVRPDQKSRGQALATYYRTCDEVLREAIDRGLRELEAERAAWVVPTGNPAEW